MCISYCAHGPVILTVVQVPMHQQPSTSFTHPNSLQVQMSNVQYKCLSMYKHIIVYFLLCNKAHDYTDQPSSTPPSCPNSLQVQMPSL